MKSAAQVAHSHSSQGGGGRVADAMPNNKTGTPEPSVSSCIFIPLRECFKKEQEFVGFTLEHLNEVFPNRWVGRQGHVEWPAQSPDLNPLDYFLWGHLKNRIYVDRLGNIEDPRARFRTEMRLISPKTIANVQRAFVERLAHCQTINGGHFEHLLGSIVDVNLIVNIIILEEYLYWVIGEEPTIFQGRIGRAKLNKKNVINTWSNIKGH
ncbi:hypothetical protein NQ318_008814 [Aromia moschata]|uniref:Uncharacterized protein n=1 Tax=Aromia moschata TaxID=1265417 RepID=A0AAV8ZA82_9CUCU|nr:hypothetical protein NQ318_008814 [Aromia moschata]